MRIVALIFLLENQLANINFYFISCDEYYLPTW